MACELKTTAYIPIVKNLFTLNPEKYKNFDNVVMFIAESGIKPENKKQAIHNIAHIYKNLHGLDAKMYELGNADAVIAMVEHMDDTTKYLKVLQDIFKFKEITKPSVENIVKKIDELGSKQIISLQDIDAVTTLIKQHIDSTNYESIEQQTNTLNDFRGMLNTLISNLSLIDDVVKTVLYAKVNNNIDKLGVKSQYIPVSTIKDLAGLDNYLFTLKNGVMVEGYEENGIVYMSNPIDGSLIELDAANVVSKKLSRPSDINPNTTGKHVFTRDFFSSGFTVDSVSPDEYDALMMELNQMDNPETQIRIHAVQLSTAGDDRVSRMKDVASKEEGFEKLANREHETFESVSQQELLKSKPDAKVLTVSRPKRSDIDFALVGEIIGTGRKFYIYSVENFAFVNADNKTELVDFNNETHLKEVQRLSVKQEGSEQIELDNNDINFVKSSHIKFQEFKSKVASQLFDAIENSQEPSVDVTNAFNNEYEFATKRGGGYEFTNLNELIDNDLTLSRPVTIIELDKDGITELSSREANLPFYYTRKQNWKTGAMEYTPVSLINTFERIKVVRPDGSFSHLTQSAYADQVLNLTARVQEMFSEKDKALEKTVKEGGSVKGKARTTNFVVRFKASTSAAEVGEISYAEVNLNNELQFEEFFAKFAVELALASGEAAISDAMKRFTLKQYQLRSLSVTGKGNVLSFSLVSQKDLNGIQLEIRPYTTSDRYDFIKNNKAAFNFPLDRKFIVDTVNKIYNKALLDRMVFENPVLKEFDLEDETDRLKFFTTVFEVLNDENATPSIKEFITNSKVVQETLTKHFDESLNKKLNADKNGEVYGEFLKFLNEDISDFKTDMLLFTTDKDGNKVLNFESSIAKSYNKRNSNRANFNSSLKNLSVMTSNSRKRFSITSRATPLQESIPTLTVAEQKIIDDVAEEFNSVDTTGFEGSSTTTDVLNTPTEEDEIDTDDFEDPDDDITAFKIVDGEFVPSTEAELEIEYAWLESALTQFGLEKSNLKDVIDLAKVHGKVLGLFKDKVIHVNNALLSKGIVYHEAFHGVFRYLMTDNERTALTSNVINDPKYAAKFTADAVYQFGRDRNYSENNYDVLAKLIAEEILADGFQNYMLKAKPGAPKTIMQQFFAMLKKLLNFFVKNQNLIDNTFSKIQTGHYKTTAIQSNIFDGKVAFELIPAQNVHYADLRGKKFTAKSTLTTTEQTQLINIVNAQIFDDSRTGISYDEKFNTAVDDILTNLFSVEKLIAQNPSKKEEILNSNWARMYSKYRFVLGARLKGLKSYDINYTGEVASDKKKTKISIPSANGPIENSRGEHSFEVLKKLAKQAYDKANTIDIARDEDADGLNSDEVENTYSGENVDVISDDELASAKDELENNNFDESLGQTNPIDSYVRQVRRYFATIRNDYFDKELGIRIPRVIDGNILFPAMLKISSNVQSGIIIQSLGVMAEKMIADGYVNEGSDLKAIFDDIKKKTDLDSQGRPQKNHQLYNIITDSLHGVELNYLFFNYASPKTITETSTEQEIMEAERTQLNFRLVDKVADTDNSAKRDKIISEFIKTFTANANKPEYKEAMTMLITESKKLTAADSIDILAGLETQSVLLSSKAKRLQELFEKVGMKFPVSLLELSLATINIKEKGQFNGLDEKDKLFLEVNKNFTNQDQYLELDFFRSLVNIMSSAYQLDGTVNKTFRKKLDDASKDINVIRFMTILKKSASYISKYDPTSLPSVIKNAEGKSIYRYSKVNPFYTLAQRLKTMSLDEAISNDPYYSRVYDYLKDSKLFSPLLREGSTAEESRDAKLFLENFDVAMFGGVQQRVGQMVKDGKTFKQIDKRSLYTLQLLSFLNRRVVTDIKSGSQLSLYYRSFHQNEATNTNFLVSSIYTPFVDLKGKVLFEGKYNKIVESLLANIKQEYNRINREWSTRTLRKTNYDGGISNDNINKYNAELSSDGKTINTDNDSLRAYNFNVLSDFFKQSGNSALKDQLIKYAKEGIEFDKIDSLDLKKALDVFAESEFQYYKQQLITGKLIELKQIPVNKLDTRDTRATAVKTYYTSSLLPKKVKTDISSNKTEDIGSMYPTPPGFDASIAHPDIVPVDSLIYDYFMNHWKNALEVNQLLDGDVSMNVKNFQDYVKRLKKGVASGSNFKEGFHTVAYMNTITAFVHEEMPTFGPYYSEEQIANDFSIKNETVRQELIFGYRKAINGTEENINGAKVKWGDMMREVFDGQSISTLMHQIDMADAIGRIDTRIKDLMIAKHYRALTSSEIKYMESKKVVNNAKKTVTAGRNAYHKNSEDYTDRLDVSKLIIQQEEDETIDEATNRIFDELHSAYSDVYNLRRQAHYLSLVDPEHHDLVLIKKDIQKIFLERIHPNYEPLSHRKVLHNILNSMEYHQVDQLMDTTASKNATKVPIDVFQYEKDENDYIRFDMSSARIPNEDKFLQVETSGVKEKAKHSVQSKLLLPADLSEKTFRTIIQKENARRGTIMSETEENALLDIKNTLNDYQLSLGKATKARLKYFQNVLRSGKDFEVGKIFTMIRKSLEQQDAPTNILQMFEVKPDGTPVYSPNLSTVRSTLEYYMLAQYSNNVTDEKTAGFKNFHVSGFGHDVMVDTETDTVITTEEVSKNPEKYSDTTRYKSRPLSVTVEIQPDGSKLYFAEVIMPKPIFENKQQEKFYMDNLTKMFGVRIPTEDKRSMIALKVVDFVDSSKQNNIIVPQFVHMLSGSDFDIDSLFGRMKSFYKNGKNDYALFGDYSQYKNEDTGKFIEFIHFMSKHDDFGPLLKAEKQKLIEENTFELSDESPVFEILDALGYDIKGDVDEFFDRQQVKSDLAKEKEFSAYMFQISKDAKQLYVETKLEAESNPVDKELARTRNQYGSEYAVIRSVKQKSIQEKAALRERLSIIDAAFMYQAALNVFAEFNLPTNLEVFNGDKIYTDMVSMKFQNDNLDASIKILGNEAVFNYLYINQRASVQQFKDVLSMYGLELEKMTQKGNLYTPTNMILSKVENGMNKDGIGRTAVMNKFLSLSSQLQLELNDDAVVWEFITENDEPRFLNKFGQLNEQNERVIAMIGNILGMFADGAKDPIPAALQLNEINVSTSLAMIGIGLKPEFVFGFNFLPGIRNASLAVQQSQFAISEDASQDYVFYNNAVNNELKQQFADNPALLPQLKALGVISEKSTEYKVILNKNNIKFDFTPAKLDLKKLDLNSLDPSDIGFKILTKKNNELTDSQASIILMAYYNEQAQQTWSINRVANMTNLFKRLNPSLSAFDRMRDGISRIKSGELFTDDSVERVFSNDSVWTTLSETLEDANQQFSKIFLERTSFFSGVSSSFIKFFKEPKNFANTITSYMALSKFKMTYPGSRVVENETLQDYIDQDDMALLETFTPEYWFTNGLADELEKMQNLYPDNEFLKLLKPEESQNTAIVTYDGKNYNSGERFLSILSRAKIKGEYANKVTDDISVLYNSRIPEEKLFIKKLFYHELVRTGLLPKKGSFLQFMPTEMQLPISDNIELFIKGLKDSLETPADTKEKFMKFMSEYLGGATNQDVYKFFNELFYQIAYSASSEEGNSKIPKYKDGKRVSSFDIKLKGKKEDNFKFTKGIIKFFLAKDAKVDFTKEDLLEAREKFVKHVLEMFSLTVDPSVNLKTMETLDIANLVKSEFVMNLTNDVSAPQMSFSKNFGIKFDKSSGMFEFPSIIKVDKKTFVLQSTDMNDVNLKSTSGETLVKSFTGEDVYTNFGLKAKYTAIPDTYSSDKISPLAFTSEQAEKYKALIEKKETINYKPKEVKVAIPEVTEVKPAETKQEETTTEISEEGISKSQIDISDANTDMLNNFFGKDWTEEDNDSENPLEC